MPSKDEDQDFDDIAALADEASWGVSRLKNDQLFKVKQQQNAWQSRGQFCITAGGDVIAKQRARAKSQVSSSVGYRIVRLSKGKLPVVCVGEPEFDANDPIASIRALMSGLRNWYAGLKGPRREQMEKLADELEGEFLPAETTGSVASMSVSVMPESESSPAVSGEPTPQQMRAQARRQELEKLSKASTYKVVGGGNISKPKPKPQKTRKDET